MIAKTILLFILFVIVVVSSVGQGLLVTGRLSDTEQHWFNDYAIWKARLFLEFKNEGTRPIILINPLLSYGTGQKEITFYFKNNWDNASDSTEIIGFVHKIPRSLERSNALKQLAVELNRDTPPENLTIILKPGESYPFSDSINVKQNYTHQLLNESGFEQKVSVWEGTTTNKNCPGELWPRKKGCSLKYATNIVINYDFDISGYADAPDLLGQLATRWSQIGVIPLNNASTLAFSSKPISVYPLQWEIVLDPTIWRPWTP